VAERRAEAEVRQRIEAALELDAVTARVTELERELQLLASAGSVKAATTVEDDDHTEAEPADSQALLEARQSVQALEQSIETQRQLLSATSVETAVAEEQAQQAQQRAECVRNTARELRRANELASESKAIAESRLAAQRAVRVAISDRAMQYTKALGRVEAELLVRGGSAAALVSDVPPLRAAGNGGGREDEGLDEESRLGLRRYFEDQIKSGSAVGQMIREAGFPPAEWVSTLASMAQPEMLEFVQSISERLAA
jgi:hypothetical protein